VNVIILEEGRRILWKILWDEKLRKSRHRWENIIKTDIKKI
jgi:hypothetical protein